MQPKFVTFLEILMSETNLDVDFLVQEFITKYSKGLSTLHRISNNGNNNISFSKFIEKLTEELSA